MDIAFEKAGGRILAFCEIDSYCQKVLHKHWPNVPIFSDIYEINRGVIENAGISTTIDIVYGGFRVSRSVWQETKKGKTIPVISGRNFRGWSEKLDRVGLSVKTYLEYSVSRQTQYVLIWSVKGTKLGFGILKLRLSVRDIGGNAYSLLRTPDAHCDRGFRNRGTFEKRMKKGLPLQLNDQIAHLYPTPTANDSKNNGNPSRENRHSPGLNGVAGGSLNPEFVEALMGFPISWTDV